MIVVDDLIKAHGLTVAGVAGAILGACRIKGLKHTDATNKVLASRLRISDATVSRSIQVLEKAKVLRTEMVVVEHGRARRIYLHKEWWMDDVPDEVVI